MTAEEWVKANGPIPYKGMYEMLQAYADYYHAEKSKWISVDDRLPEKGERVIIYGGNLGVLSVVAHIGLYGDWRENHITHWQPLPSPPKN